MSYQIINGEYVKMRHESEMPQNPTEQSMENVLVDLGIDPEDLEFCGESNSSQRYIRYQYWKVLPIALQQLSNMGLEETVDADDDFNRYYYYI